MRAPRDDDGARNGPRRFGCGAQRNEDDPIIMYVGDYTSDYVSKAYGCNNSKHTTVLKYTEIFNGREAS